MFGDGDGCDMTDVMPVGAPVVISLRNASCWNGIIAC